ncbi:hypothetical protein [Conchiformibius kuhniae]|uniref:Uncharacterized protein n=1 Tax=Conchiformibius kuhniae TaxID=211502 RepID=A0A8T9MZA4_9NEIS|nr:hypothetical protein [Conchiformibius kuhniae]UOP05123.1 hypothetical protein LVJ77_02265 [Conchiformibius kuhniae]
MEIEIIEYGNHKQIFYRNGNGVAQRILVLDLNHQIIQDELSEYDANGKCVANMVFAPDHTTVIDMRKYTENGSEDYRRINGKLVLVQTRTSRKIDEHTAKTEFYNADGELVFYDVFQYENDEIGMVFSNRFDKNGKELDWGNPGSEYRALQNYSDY